MTNKIDHDEIDLIELVHVVLRHKIIIIAITLIFFLVSGISSVMMYKKSKLHQTIVTFNFKEKLENKNPDLSEFNIDSIKSPAILKKVKEKFPKLDITLNDLAASIYLTPIIPSNEKSKMIEAEKKGEEYKYFPNQYYVSFKYFKDKQDREILSTIIDEYEKFYINNHKNIIVAGKVVLEDSYSFNDSFQFLDNSLSRLLQIVDLKDKSFVSPTLGKTLEDINLELDNLKNIELHKYKVKFMSSIASRNSSDLGETLNLRIVDKKRELLKEQGRLDVLKKLLSDYNVQEKETLVLVEGKAVSVTDKSDYYLNMLNKITLTSIKISDYKLEISDLLDKLKKSKNKNVDQDLIKNQLLSLENDIVMKINNLTNQINTVIKEKNDIYYSNIIQKAEIIEAAQNNIVKITLVATIFGLILGIFISFVIEVYKKVFKNVKRSS